MNNRSPARVWYVVSYRDPEYIRTRSTSAALALVPNADVIELRNRSTGPHRYLETVRQIVANRKARPDLLLIGFRGHELVPILMLLMPKTRRVLDVLVSPSEALVSEGKAGRIGKFIGRLIFPIERAILRRCDDVVVDTHANATFYRRRFGIASDRIHVVPVGTGPAIPSDRQPRPAGSKLRALFYGTFLPLHGVDHILSALALVEPGSVQLRLIGGSPELIDTRVAELGIRGDLVVHDRWVPLQEILDVELPAADICLGGPFGGTQQAQRVVTGKTYESLAAGCPTVIGATPELTHWGLSHQQNCLVVRQANATSLASILRWAASHPEQLAAIGRAGAIHYEQVFSPAANARRFQAILASSNGRQER